MDPKTEYKFEHYDPKKLVPIFRERGYSPSSHSVCQGCVISGVSPSDRIHPNADFGAPEVQSDEFCSHCRDIVNENGKAFPLSADRKLSEKVRELEKIMDMASL